MNNYLNELQEKSNQFAVALKQEFMGMRSNRPSPRMVEDIYVEAYGQKMSVKQLGAISIVPPMQIQISVWDKTIVGAVAKAIESSNLNVNANIEGNLIRINLPPLSDERRKELVKVVKKETEETKIKIRSVRDEIQKKINRDFDSGEITEDEKFKIKDKIQEIMDKSNKELDDLLEKKIKEIEE